MKTHVNQNTTSAIIWFMLIAAMFSATQSPTPVQTDGHAPNQATTTLIESATHTNAINSHETLRQVSIILYQNYVDSRRLESKSLIFAGLENLAREFPAAVEVVPPHDIANYMASYNQAFLCKKPGSSVMQFCKTPPRTNAGFAARPTQQSALVRIGERVFRMPLEPWSLAQISEPTSRLMGLLEEIEKTTHQTQEDIDYIFLNGLLPELDPHSAFLNSQEYRDLKNGTRGRFDGVGITLRGSGNLPVVDDVTRDSPAHKAGILTGDIIIRVNEDPTIFKPVELVTQNLRKLTLRGEVEAWIYRPSQEQVFKAKLHRELLDTRTVSYSEIAGAPTTAYIRISSFSDTTAEDLQEILSQKTRESKHSNIILDLRGNPGGLLDEAVKVADLFLPPSQPIVSVRTRLEAQNELASFREKFTQPMAVLIDSGSASASEIVAGALRDHGRAVIVGERSYGKGSIQSLFETGQGSALKLTVAHYFTPNSHSIQSHGIIPHITTRTAVNHNGILWLEGSAEDDRESELPFRLDNPEKTNTAPTENIREHLSTIWTERAYSDFAVGALKAPLLPRRSPDWQSKRTPQNDFTLRTALVALEKIAPLKVVPTEIPVRLVRDMQNRETSRMSPALLKILPAQNAAYNWKATNVRAKGSANDFAFEIYSKEDPLPQMVPVVIHTNGKTDGPTLLVAAKATTFGARSRTMEFHLPEFAIAARSLQNQRATMTVGMRPSLNWPEIPVGQLNGASDNTSMLDTRKSSVELGTEQLPCSANPTQKCVRVALSVPNEAASANAKFSLVPFLSHANPSHASIAAHSTFGKTGNLVFELEIPTQSYDKRDANGIVAAMLQNPNGEIVGAWPLIAIRDGAVEKLSLRENKN